MIRPEFKKKLERQHAILFIVWVAFVHAVFLYLSLTNFLLSRSSAYGLSETVRIALWVLSLSVVWVLLWWRRRFLTKDVILGRATKLPVKSSLQDYKSPVEERAAEAITYYATMKLGTFGLAESVAIFGFVLAFIGGYLWDQYLLSLISGVLLLFQFPSKDFLEELIRDVEVGGG